jgi:amino acid transporter
MAEAPKLPRTLGVLDLALLNIAAVVALRWLSFSARIGPSSLTLWLLGMVTFFVPSVLTVLELSSRLPGEGGIYIWAKAAFGDLHAFVVGWAYWISNLVFFPSLLLFLSGISLYIGGGRWLALRESAFYNSLFCLVALWFAILLNVLGLRRAKWLQNVGGAATWIAGALVLGAGAVALHQFGSATPIGVTALRPDLRSLATLNSFTAMAFAYSGLELGPILGGEIKNPRYAIARAALIACAAVPILYIAGTAALLVIIPAQQINLVSGIPQALEVIGGRVGLPAFGMIVAALLALSQAGTLGAWLAGTARLPFLFGIDRYLPEALGSIHPKFGSPHIALVAQGTLTSIILLCATSGSAVHEAFLVLIDMSIILVFLPLLYMFAALPALRRRHSGDNGFDVTMIPGGMTVCWLVTGSGVGVTLLGIAVAMVPPAAAISPKLFALKVVGGSVFLISMGLIFYVKGRHR